MATRKPRGGTGGRAHEAGAAGFRGIEEESGGKRLPGKDEQGGAAGFREGARSAISRATKRKVMSETETPSEEKPARRGRASKSSEQVELTETSRPMRRSRRAAAEEERRAGRTKETRRGERQPR